MATALEINKQAQDRRRRAHDLRQQGLTYREVGEVLGVSRARARQLDLSYARRERRRDWWGADLSVRIRNVLLNEGCTSKADAEKLGELPDESLLKTPNFGKDSLAEFRLWLDGKLPKDAGAAARAVKNKRKEMDLERSCLTAQDAMERKKASLRKAIEKAERFKVELAEIEKGTAA